jgi:hypothetical protein
MDHEILMRTFRFTNILTIYVGVRVHVKSLLIYYGTSFSILSWCKGKEY